MADNALFLVMMIGFVGLLGLAIVIKPRLAMLVFLICIPFSGMQAFSGRMLNLPGVSMINILLFIPIMFFIMNMRKNGYLGIQFKRRAIFFWLIVLVAIASSCLRINDIQMFVPNVTRYSYFRTYFMRPFCIWLCFLVIIKMVESKYDFIQLVRYMFFSTVVTSMLILYADIYFFAKTGSYTLARNVVGDFLGVHANDYAVMYTLLVPFILGALSLKTLGLKERIMGLVSLVSSIFVIAFSYSRSCYLVLFFSILAFSLMKAKRYLIVILILAVLAPLILPSSIQERVRHGLDESDKNPKQTQLDQISAGRLTMWSMLFKEFIGNKKNILIGNGRNSIYRTQARKKGLGVSHPHNAYLEVLFDVGIIGLLVFFSFYGHIYRKLRLEYKRYQGTEYEKFYFGGLIGYLGYLILCLTGRSFFPGLRFVYLWLLLGFIFSLSKINALSEDCHRNAER